MILNYISWNPSPEIFKLGGFEVRWYGLFFALAFYFGYIIINKFFKKEGIPNKLLDNLTVYMGVGTIVGARLGHCLFYEPERYLSNPIEILKIWEGGLASHGAAIGILLALFIFAKQHKKSYLWIIDRIVIVVALSGFFIRMGNLMNSEIFGTITSVPWAFKFVQYDNAPRHPTQIYEALCYLGIFLFLLSYYYKKEGKPQHGIIFSYFLVSLFVIRFLIEFIKIEQVSFERGMTLNMGQLLSIPFILFGTGLYFFLKSKQRNINTDTKPEV